MKGIKHLRRLVDMLMIVTLPLLMAFELIGRATHEWLGMTMMLLVVIHQALNWKWYRNIFRGKYNAVRIATLVMDLLLIMLMILQAISGISMARHLPDALPALMRRSVARSIHMTCAYWCFALMCVHAGFHMSVIMRRIKSAGWAAIGAAAIYGAYAFVKRQLPGYMFMQIRFAFFDYEEPLLFFFVDYLAIMVLFLVLGCLLSSVLKKGKKR